MKQVRLYLVCKFPERGKGRVYHIDIPGRHTFETKRLQGPDVNFDVPEGVRVEVKAFSPDNAGNYDTGRYLCLDSAKPGKGQNADFQWTLIEVSEPARPAPFNRAAAVERIIGNGSPLTRDDIADSTDDELRGMLRLIDLIESKEVHNHAATAPADPAVPPPAPPAPPPAPPVPPPAAGPAAPAPVPAGTAAMTTPPANPADAAPSPAP